MLQQKKKVLVWIIIISCVLVLGAVAGAYFAFFRGEDEPVINSRESNISEDIEKYGEAIPYDGPLVGNWHQVEYGVHGNALYLWSFGENGYFAFLFSAREPPHGEIDGSVREFFMKGKFRINGNSIECYDVKYDDYFAWGDEWKYFSDRNPENLAGLLLATPLKDVDNKDNFSIDFELDESMTLRLVIDLGEFPNQYDMDFEKIN